MKNLLTIDKPEDISGVKVAIHVEGEEELMCLAYGLLSLYMQNPELHKTYVNMLEMVCMNPELVEEMEKNTFVAPDFNKILKDIK